jgi:hypothetical protein
VVRYPVDAARRLERPPLFPAPPVSPCTVCAQVKPLSEFYAAASNFDGLQVTCKTCTKQRRREQTIRSYGITPEEYDALLASQGGGCAICGVAENPSGLRLPVDHDHATGEVRGILCSNCNSGIGMLGDNPDRVIAAAAYLLERADVLGSLARS